MSKTVHRSFFLKGHAGRLEALLWTTATAGAPRLVAVVCHPHPLYGGTMHNKVVFQIAKGLHRLQIPVLRFNFRGAGLSEGQYDKGVGEQDDVSSAVDYLAGEYHKVPMLLAGFSFGASVGLRVGCSDGRVTELVGLGLPADDSDLNYLKGCSKPKLFLQGEQDQFGSKENVQALVDAMQEPKRLIFIEGADHFFSGMLAQVNEALHQWMKEHHPEL
jgi:alpha/beta superfamily hydrolase